MLLLTLLIVATLLASTGSSKPVNALNKERRAPRSFSIFSNKLSLPSYSFTTSFGYIPKPTTTGESSTTNTKVTVTGTTKYPAITTTSRTSSKPTTTISTTTTSTCPSPTSAVTTATCGYSSYVYSQLAGFGYVANNARDKFGDTLGGFGSSIAFDPTSWSRHGDTYQGTLYAVPDRGWNTNGTLNYRSRVQKFTIALTLNCTATVSNPSPPNINITYQDTILLGAPNGDFTTGLDADTSQPYLSFYNTEVPAATYPGNGFGGTGPGGHRASVDAEGLVLNSDGSFWVSDEYGPYIYKVAPTGTIRGVIRPPDAFIPLRNGSDSFSSINPPIYDPTRIVIPENPTQGRSNNQGFEGLTASPDGTRLYALLQSAMTQEGGTSNAGRRNARLVVYDTTSAAPTLVGEYVVPLPTYVNNNNNTRVAAQSEIKYVSQNQILVLARDSGAGRAAGFTNSIYRHADVFDISSATNILGQYDAFNDSIASTSGVLKSAIVPATYCSFLDYNINDQLNRFGLHNGGTQDAGLLNEKWESLALLPVNPGDPESRDFFLFTISDNDFITQDGYMNSGQFKYRDGSGFNVDNQVLAFQVSLPTSSPRVG